MQPCMGAGSCGCSAVGVASGPWACQDGRLRRAILHAERRFITSVAYGQLDELSGDMLASLSFGNEGSSGSPRGPLCDGL